MKKAGLFLIAILFIMAFNDVGNRDNAVGFKPRDGIFLHITHDHNDPHRVLMPLQMATMMAEDKDVLIYMDIDAVKLLTKDAADVEYAHFTPMKESLKNLLEMGVGIYACPACMKAADIESGDLLKGVKVAEKERFFDFTEGRIIAINY